MYPTVEIRWFYRGAVPDEVRKWLQAAAGPAEAQSPRIDYYLLQPNRDDLSVKFREGRIEIKQRWRHFDGLSSHERIGGTMEGWRKWSFNVVVDPGEPESFLRPKKSWVSVNKNRWLRTMTLAADDEIEVVTPGEEVDSGCEIEVTNLVVSGNKWWTLGLEAYGQEPSLESILRATLRHILTTPHPPRLARRASWSYPAWLLHLNLNSEAPL